MNVYDKVKEVLIEQLGLDEGDVSLDSKIVDDLGADSLDIVEIIIALEEECDIEIPDEDIPINTSCTVANIVNYVQQKI